MRFVDGIAHWKCGQVRLFRVRRAPGRSMRLRVPPPSPSQPRSIQRLHDRLHCVRADLTPHVPPDYGRRSIMEARINSSVRDLVGRTEAEKRRLPRKRGVEVFEQIIEAFTGDTIRRRRGLGDPSDTPVFIFGMPRSGSTLIEQILASHSQSLRRRGNRRLRKRDHGSSRRRGKRAAISRELLRRFRRCAAKSQGALPAKRHGRRPGGRSVCLCPPHPSRAAKGANDPCAPRSDRHLLVVLAHWRGVLPQDVMLEVQYEDVVEDIETQIRRILVHCSLELDARGAGGATSRSLRRFFGERPLEPLSRIRRGPRRPP